MTFDDLSGGLLMSFHLMTDANNTALRENAVKKGAILKENVIFDQHDVVWRLDVMPKAGSELRQMMRSAKPAILVDPDSKIVAANGAWRSLCGYPGDKAINETPKVLHGPATDKTKATDFASSLLQHGSGWARPFATASTVSAGREHRGPTTSPAAMR